MISFVTLYKQTATGHAIEKEARYCLAPKQALIDAYMQLKGNYNTWEYPSDIDGIIASRCVKGRYYIELENGDILQADIC